MGVDVAVLRVFTDPDGNFGNPLGVVDAGRVEPRDRQRLATQLGYSETVFVDLPAAGATTAHATIYTPRTEIAFAGHPIVGLSWWLRDRVYRRFGLAALRGHWFKSDATASYVESRRETPVPPEVITTSASPRSATPRKSAATSAGSSRRIR